MKPRQIAQLAALGLVVAGMAHAETTDPRAAELKAGLEAFDRGAALARTHPDDSQVAFHQSIAHFEALVAGGLRNGRVYYNLGNAYMQVGDLGKAIISYRRAERLLGEDPLLLRNLSYARSMCRTHLEASGGKQLLHTVFFWHYDTPLKARYAVALGAYVLFWIILAVRRVNRSPAVTLLAGCLLVLWLAAGASAGIEFRQRAGVRPGVLTKPEVVVRKGNGEAYDPQFKEALSEGTEFILIEERSGWIKIELPDGKTGWVKADQVELL